MLTDNEIIKALECCRDGDCKSCTFDECTTGLLDEGIALSLINRQKAEIEELDHKLGWLLCHATGNKLSKSTYPLETMRSAVNDYIEDCYREAETEAIKEFAERLKAKFDQYGVDYTAYAIVDDVAKEMGVGDNADM